MKPEDLECEFEQTLLVEFEGFVRIDALFGKNDLPKPPDSPGVYVVVYPDAKPPHFSAVSPAVEHWGDKLNVPPEELELAWVNDAQAIYFGQTGSGESRQTLRGRIQELIDLPRGIDSAHRGGKRMWYLTGWTGLRVAWRAMTEGDPSHAKAALVHSFEEEFKKRPFANEIEPAVRNSTAEWANNP